MRTSRPSRAQSSRASPKGAKAPGAGPRRRLPTGERRAQILSNAARMIGENGLTTFSFEEVARSCGISKGLIYVHFATQADVLGAVMRREYERLSAAGLDEALQIETAEEALVACADIYLQHVVKYGTVLRALLGDPLFVRQMSARERTMRDRVVRDLARKLHRECHFPIKEAIVVVVLLAAIPERAGRQVFEGHIDLALAEMLCADLVRDSLRALIVELDAVRP